MDLLVTAIDKCDYTGKIKIGIDSAAVEFFNSDIYDIDFKDEHSGKPHTKLSATELGDLYRNLLDRYPIVLLEDPFAEDDWTAWTAFNKTCQVELVGDDLLATNIERIKIAEQKDACNSMLLKINQIGTITEAIKAYVPIYQYSDITDQVNCSAKMAYSLGWSVFVSHRSGETTDDFIADLTVGLGAGHLKSGSPCRGERVAKYNRLMDIEAELQLQDQMYLYAGTGLG